MNIDTLNNSRSECAHTRDNFARAADDEARFAKDMYKEWKDKVAVAANVSITKSNDAWRHFINEGFGGAANALDSMIIVCGNLQRIKEDLSRIDTELKSIR